MARQEEEDAVEPVAGARGRCQQDGKAPFCLQRRLWKDMERVDDWSSLSLSNLFDSFSIDWVMFKMFI